MLMKLSFSHFLSFSVSQFLSFSLLIKMTRDTFAISLKRNIKVFPTALLYPLALAS